MTSLSKSLLGATMCAGVITFSAISASAAVVCRGSVCWHSHETYEYPAGAHVVIHPDDWKWGPREHFAWREHEGRGYWNGRRWSEW
jgi:hypothetical protein